MKLFLIRSPSSDEGTAGLLLAPSSDFKCRTLELPFRDNLPQVSSIPAGAYLCKWIKSLKFGWTYQVLDVPNRGNILFHSGNYAGNSDLGFKTHSHGCILPCTKIGRLNNQLAGLVSKPAVTKLFTLLNKQSFQLEILNA